MPDIQSFLSIEPEIAAKIIKEIYATWSYKTDLSPHERLFKIILSMYAADGNLDLYSFSNTVGVIGILSGHNRSDGCSWPDRSFAIGTREQDLARGTEFLRRVSASMRNSIFSETTERYHAEETHLTTEMIARGAGSVLASHGVSNPMALGLAVLTLLVLARACPTFREMSDEEVVEAITTTASTRANLKKPDDRDFELSCAMEPRCAFGSGLWDCCQIVH